MSTHDYILDNAAGAAFRADLNLTLAAIVTKNSSSTEPGTTYAGMWWYDTANNILYARNSANNAWIKMFTFDQSNNSAHAAGGFPSGTSLSGFLQAAAPTGWTKITGWTNRTIIVGDTYGSGGSDNPISWSAGVSVAAHSTHSHTGPSHTHTGPSHTHSVVVPYSGWTGSYGQPAGRLGYSCGTPSLDSGVTANKTLTSGSGGTGNTGSAGTGNTGNAGPTSHTVTQNTYTPLYQVVIAATKD